MLFTPHTNPTPMFVTCLEALFKVWRSKMDLLVCLNGSVYLKSVPLSAQSSGVLDQRVYSDSSLDLGHPLPVPVWRLSPH